MKKLLFCSILLAATSGLFAQSTTATNAGGAGRYLGYSNNVVPLLFQTNALPRMKLNQTVSYPINGYAGNRDGYLLIGFEGNSLSTGLSMYNSIGAYSLLHLNGRNTQIQEFGHKPWMQTGVTFTDNRDHAYVGLRKLGTVDDFTEMVVAWSDNGPGTAGPDKMVFRFMGFGGTDGASASSNLLSNTDLDGLHIAQYMPTGLMALGNTFGTNASLGTNYVEPQSLFHQSYTYRPGADFDPFGFMQITYRGTGIRGIGETENDGLRFGIDNTVLNGGLNAYLRWQEGTPLIVQTDWDDVPGDVVKGERLRVSATGMPGVPAAPSGASNLTRVSISYNGIFPVAAPKATLQIGFDSPLPASYANWMEYGTLVANSTSTLFTGLTNQTAADPWQSVIGFGGSNLLFANASGGEMARIQQATGNMGIGNFGSAGLASAPSEKIDVNGNARFRNIPAAGGNSIILGLQPGTNANDVKLSRLALPADPSLYLAGNGTWQPIPIMPVIPAPIPTGAHNGATVSTLDPNNIAFGQILGQAGSPGRLLSNREVPMNDNNILFTNTTGANNNANRIGIGTNTPAAKLDVNLNGSMVGVNPTALSITNSQTGGGIGNIVLGQSIRVTGSNYSNHGSLITVSAATNNTRGLETRLTGSSPTSNTNVGLAGSTGVSGGLGNYGVMGLARLGRNNTGGYFEGGATGTNISTFNRGVWAFAYGAGTNTNSAVYAYTQGSGSTNYGVESRVISTTGINYGVYATVMGNVNNPSNNDRAGYFAGKLQTTAASVITSDSMFKTDLAPIGSPLKTLAQLNPVSYYMDTVTYDNMRFGSEQQFGFIAQDVAHVLPSVVHHSVHPAEYDSSGVEITPALEYKALNYNAFIPINTAAIIELNRKVDQATLSDQTAKTNVTDLSGSLNKVLQMRGVEFDWDTAANPEMRLDSLRHVGFIAQEIELIEPLVTFMGDDSLVHVDYAKIVPIAVEAIKELNGVVEIQDSIINALETENADQQATIDDLNNRLSQLENCLSGILPYLCQLSNNAIQANTPAAQEEVRKNLNVTLSSRNTIILDQNVPNPFAEQTVINFSIPETVQKAQIHFYDGMGKLIQSVDVAERGLGSVTVFGSDLSSGMYTYTLVADGQAVATKKMMKQ